jgi:hypothetical protein
LLLFRENRFAGHQDLIAMQGEEPNLLIGSDLAVLS